MNTSTTNRELRVYQARYLDQLHKKRRLSERYGELCRENQRLREIIMNPLAYHATIRYQHRLAVIATDTIFANTGKLVWWSCAPDTVEGLRAAFRAFTLFVQMWGVDKFVEAAAGCAMTADLLKAWFTQSAELLDEPVPEVAS